MFFRKPAFLTKKTCRIREILSGMLYFTQMRVLFFRHKEAKRKIYRVFYFFLISPKEGCFVSVTPP